MPKGVGAVSGIIIDAPHRVESPLAAVLTLPSERAFLNPSQILLDQLEQVNNERVAAVEAAQARLAAEAEESTIRASWGSNEYPAGQCTRYIKDMRPDIPNHLGNANKWFNALKSLGWEVGYEPRVGAIGQSIYGVHVVYIHEVSGSQVYLSERNYDYQGSYRERWANASGFKYIYD